MNIYQCIDQLNKLLKEYNLLSTFNNRISNYLIYIDKENLTFDDIFYMHIKLYNLYNDSTNNIRNIIVEYYKEVYFLDADTTKNCIYSYINELNNDSSIYYIIKSMYIKLEKIINTNSALIKDHLKLEYIKEYYMPSKISGDKLLDIFNIIITCRSKLVEYMNSLELPEKPDYEIK